MMRGDLFDLMLKLHPVALKEDNTLEDTQTLLVRLLLLLGGGGLQRVEMMGDALSNACDQPLLIGWSKDVQLKNKFVVHTLYRPVQKYLQVPIIVNQSTVPTGVCLFLFNDEVTYENEDLGEPAKKQSKPQEPHKVSACNTTDSSMDRKCVMQSAPVCSLEDLYDFEVDSKDFDSVWRVRKQQLQQSAEQRALTTFRQNVKERKKLQQVIDESLKPYGELYEMAQLVKLHFEAEKNEWLSKVSQQYPETRAQSSQHVPSLLLEERLCSECHRRKRRQTGYYSEDSSEYDDKRQRVVESVPYSGELQNFLYDAIDQEATAPSGEDEEEATCRVGKRVAVVEGPSNVKKVCIRKFNTPYKTNAAVDVPKAAIVEM